MKRLIPCLLLLALLLSACTITPFDPDGSSGNKGNDKNNNQNDVAEDESSSGWKTENGITCFYNEDGSLHTGWLTDDGKTYYLDAQGVLQTGWLELDGKRYYMQPEFNGAMSRGEVIINGRSHFFTSSGDEILIANPWNSLPDNYTPELVEAENDYWVDVTCVDYLMEMLEDCRDAGYDAQICSAFRDQETQEYLYDRKVNYYLDLGYSQEEARKEAGTVVAVPGTSEHQLGLAVDLVDNSYWGLDEEQENTPTQKWLMEHCWEYGFILRYPNDKSDVTGIIYEPWHYRYVGHKVAKELYESGLCLEEYLNSLY